MEADVMYTTILVCSTLFLTVCAISVALAIATNFDSFLKYLRKKEPRDKPMKIRLNRYEKEKYMEFLFRHGYDPRDCTFAKDALFEKMQRYELSILDREEQTMYPVNRTRTFGFL
jgi:hypothetical protein